MRAVFIYALAGVSLALAGCTASSGKAPLEIFTDMRHQPKYKAQAENDFFADRRADRSPVPGTVARGYAKLDDAFYEGVADGKYVPNPLPMNAETLARGRERFDVYCSPCHDRTGSGRGIVAQRATWLAQNLTDPRIRSMPDGEIFDTITHGKRSMPAYRYQIGEHDRWAIIAYVRALQRASAGTLNDVPPELRNQLR
jgi:mono/diheme cytochrome c family protein